MNITRNVSLFAIFQFVALGGATSLLLSLLLQNSVESVGNLFPPLFGMLEEFGKFAVVLVCVKALGPARYPYVLNGLLIGACVGAGFASAESAGYALVFGRGDGDTITHIIYLRGVLAPFGHVAWTAITAGALWRAMSGKGLSLELLTSDRTFQKTFLLPVILHGIWDMDFELPFQLKYVLLGLTAWIALFSLMQIGIRQIRDLQAAASAVVAETARAA